MSSARFAAVYAAHESLFACVNDAVRLARDGAAAFVEPATAAVTAASTELAARRVEDTLGLERTLPKRERRSPPD